MRITTQMLAHSAAKSGIPFQQTTLLDILNKKSSFSGLLNGVNASADATAIAKKKNYSKLEDISGNLNGYASSLVATDKNSIYDRAKESGSTKDIVSSAKKMVESYNATLKQLRETGDTLNEFYRQQLKDIPAGDKEALKSIGITQAKDGSLSIDEKVLQSADADTLKKVLDGDTGLASKISFVSGRISQNAASNVVSTSSQYSIGVFDNVEILGYRNDISNLVALSDISLSSSRQEGLPINLIEAMAIGNPIVATDVRGNNDLVKNGINGFTVPLNDSAAMADAVMKIYNSPQLALDFKNQNAKEVKNYSVESVIDDMVGIYKDLLLL